MPALTPANDLIRSVNVTASEVGALLDKHPYSSPASIYDRLATPLSEVKHEQTEPMALGSFFEPYIAKYAARKLGLRLRANGRTLEHGRYPLCATPDYYVLGSRMLVEVKLSSKLYVWSEETLQPYIEWQARAQLAVTDRDVCIIVALVGSTFYHVEIVRDLEKEKRIEQAVVTFYRDNVLAGVRPEEVDTRVSRIAIVKS